MTVITVTVAVGNQCPPLTGGAVCCSSQYLGPIGREQSLFRAWNPVWPHCFKHGGPTGAVLPRMVFLLNPGTTLECGRRHQRDQQGYLV